MECVLAPRREAPRVAGSRIIWVIRKDRTMMNARGMAAGLAVTLSGLLLGGCVPVERYKEALAANSRAQAALDAVRQETEAAIAARQQLELDLAAMKMAASRKDQMISELDKVNAASAKRFAELQARYTRDTADLGPPPMAGIALPPELDLQLQQWAGDHGDLVVYDRMRGMVKFKTDLVFAPGSDDVSGAAAGTLKKFAVIVNGAKAATFHVYIAGHTDDIRIAQEATRRRHPTNWYLSVHRAVSVKDVLAKAGVDEKRLGIVGFGEFHPVAPNAPGKKGNPVNRRVEIWIVPPGRLLTTNGAAPAAKPADTLTK